MSTTLAWASSGVGTKTGTAIANLFDDLDTLITSYAANPAFFWEKAGKNSATDPRWLLLRPKDGSNRRIAIINWVAAPAGNNTAILDTAPSQSLYIVYFPNGSANTLSNLTSASGTVCGNDTGAVKCSVGATVASAYGASFVPFYMDCADGMVFAWGNPATSGSGSCVLGAGTLVVDAADAAYDCTFGFSNGLLTSFGAQTSGVMPWTVAALATSAGGSTGSVRTNYGANNRTYFQAFLPSGTWASQAVSSNDILSDTATKRSWFVPMQLLGHAKGEGFVLKLRQIAMGPGSLGAFTIFNTTGPALAATQFCPVTAGGIGYPWFTQFKV